MREERRSPSRSSLSEGMALGFGWLVASAPCLWLGCVVRGCIATSDEVGSRCSRPLIGRTVANRSTRASTLSHFARRWCDSVLINRSIETMHACMCAGHHSSRRIISLLRWSSGRYPGMTTPFHIKEAVRHVKTEHAKMACSNLDLLFFFDRIDPLGMRHASHIYVHVQSPSCCSTLPYTHHDRRPLPPLPFFPPLPRPPAASALSAALPRLGWNDPDKFSFVAFFFLAIGVWFGSD